MLMNETDLERLIDFVQVGYLRRYDGFDRILEDLRQQLAARRSAEVVFRPDPAGVWWIGPAGRERAFRCRLSGIWPAYLAIQYSGDGSRVLRASDFAEPGAAHPANTVRNAIRSVGRWAESEVQCRELAVAIRRIRVGRDGSISCRPVSDGPKFLTD